MRIGFALPFVVTRPRLLAGAIVAVLAAAGAGAAGGLAYSATRPILRRLGRPGDYLSGIVCVSSYMGAVALVAPIAFGESPIEDRTDLLVFAVVSVGFGLLVGHSWFKE